MNTFTGLECRDCCKSYGRQRVLDHLTLSVAPGEIVGLVGPNGAGKTSLLHGIVGLTRFDAGRVLVAGVPAGDPAGKRQIGFMPDDLPRPKTLTALEILKLSTQLYGVPFDRAFVQQMAHDLELANKLDLMLSGFSHGMSRKVDLMAALIVKPQVLILDEPFSGMDPVTVETIYSLLRILAAQGVSVLLSSHDLELAVHLVDRVLMLNGGHIVFNGTPEDLISVPGADDVRSAFQTIVKG